MKKTGIITYHGADNYGSLLQAYALKSFLQDNYCEDTRIVNYVSSEQKKMYNLFFENNSIKNIIKNIYILTHNFKIHKNKAKALEVFREEFLKASVNDSFEVFDEKSKEYDYVICGSDQIWNTKIDDFNFNYFADFTDKAVKASYAASMGGKDLSFTGYQEDVSRCLQNFKKISVREERAKSVVLETIDREVSVNIDPVFLLGQDEWNRIASERLIREDYIFFYAIDYHKEYLEIAKSFSRKYNMPVYIMNTAFSSYKACSDNIRWAPKQSVQDFISLIKNAKIVLSASFHGTAFSILYNKPFYRVQRLDKGNSLIDARIETLFDKLGVTGREININNYKNYLDKDYQMDYENINKKINQERISSEEYFDSIFE